MEFYGSQSDGPEFDLFISYASEDRELVDPLAKALRSAGYSVWYDQFVLRAGDSLTSRIDDGLSRSVAGIVVLSPAFIAKAWPRRELAGLTARQLGEGTRIIPIWHNLAAGDILAFSPPLADVKAVQASSGMEQMVREITAAVRKSASTSFGQIVDSARARLEEGHTDLSMKVAFAALDKFLVWRLDDLREQGRVSPDVRVEQSAGATWQVLAALQSTGNISIPENFNEGFLADAMERVVFRWSMAAKMPEAEENARTVIDYIDGIIRLNRRT